LTINRRLQSVLDFVDVNGIAAKPLPLPSDQAALFFVPTIPNGRGGLVIDLMQRNISSTPLIHPNMVYACESVGCHDIFHSRIEKRKERHHCSHQPRCYCR
jgi:hypothetical protein